MTKVKKNFFIDKMKINPSLIFAGLVIIFVVYRLARKEPPKLICISPEYKCGNTCKNLQTDFYNCGSCGNECSLYYSCEYGICVNPVKVLSSNAVGNDYTYENIKANGIYSKVEYELYGAGSDGQNGEDGLKGGHGGGGGGKNYGCIDLVEDDVLTLTRGLHGPTGGDSILTIVSGIKSNTYIAGGGWIDGSGGIGLAEYGDPNNGFPGAPDNYIGGGGNGGNGGTGIGYAGGGGGGGKNPSDGNPGLGGYSEYSPGSDGSLYYASGGTGGDGYFIAILQRGSICNPQTGGTGGTGETGAGTGGTGGYGGN